ncbi:MAG: hypothetical protein AAF085_01050 [Planctomycetota bacterium]
MPESAQAETDTEVLDDDTALLDYAATRDLACPACGYNLRMINKPVCPECGLPLKLTVGSDKPFKRAWAIALCLNAMIAGMGLFFLLATLAEEAPRFDTFYVYIWYLGPILWIPVPMLLFGFRSAFCKLKTSWQYVTIALIIGWAVLIAISIFADF